MEQLSGWWLWGQVLRGGLTTSPTHGEPCYQGGGTHTDTHGEPSCRGGDRIKGDNTVSHFKTERGTSLEML